MGIIIIITIIIIIIIIVVVVIIIIIIIIIIIPKQLKLNFPLKYIRCPYCSVIKWWLVHKFSSLFASNKQRFPSKRVEALFELGSSGGVVYVSTYYQQL